MKILQIHWRYNRYGGGERYFLDLCNALEEIGHKVSVISSYHPANYHIKDRRECFIDGSFGLRSGYKMWSTVRNIVYQEDPDIIHLHETLVFLSPFIIKKLLKLKPAVQTIHTAFFFVLKVQRYCPAVIFVILAWVLSAYLTVAFEKLICG